MARRWGLVFAVMSIMVAFAANSVMTRYIIVGGLATPYLLSTVRFASGFAMLLTLQVAFPGPASRVPTAVNLVGGVFLGAYAFAISFGYLFISAAAGTLVFFAFVVLTMALFGYLHDGDRPSRRSVAVVNRGTFSSWEWFSGMFRAPGHWRKLFPTVLRPTSALAGSRHG